MTLQSELMSMKKRKVSKLGRRIMDRLLGISPDATWVKLPNGHWVMDFNGTTSDVYFHHLVRFEVSNQ